MGRLTYLNHGNAGFSKRHDAEQASIIDRAFNITTNSTKQKDILNS